MSGASLLVAACTVLVTVLPAAPSDTGEEAPYPRSNVIESITFDESTHWQEALGSDQFGTTWGSDGSLYVAWGDGAGFGATDYREQHGPNRASLGVSRIEGPASAPEVINVWGGKNPLTKQPSTRGKTSAGVIAVGETIYLYVLEQDVWTRAALWSTRDRGNAWTNHGWLIDEPDGAFTGLGILQFGRANANARDDFVYGYAETGFTNGVGLFRVPKESIAERGAYEFYAGTKPSGSPIWSANVKDRKPVFTDPNGAEWGVTCVYNAPLRRYLLAVRHNGESGNWGLFDASEPWGPWTTVAYGRELPEWTWTPAGASQRPSYIHTFPSKWISEDGLTLWHIYDRNDSFNLARATLRLRVKLNADQH